MSARPATRLGRAVRACAVAVAVLTGLLAAGCAHGPAGPQRASVESCTQFGINAIKHHITVTSLPAACRGLTRAQVNFAVGHAIDAMAATVHGKARLRARARDLSPLLAHLVTTVPPQRGQPVPASAPRQASGPALRLLTLVSWLITVGLGTWMMVRWIARGGLRRADLGRSVLPPSVTLSHFGLAVAGLLAWIAYLATGLTGLAWAACVLLLPVAGLGMALVFWAPERPRTATAATDTAVPVTAATAVPATAATAVPAAQAVPVGGGVTAAPASAGPPPLARHPPALIVAAHGVFAVTTILFALLAAVGSG
jgi:manganese efflux pump family protein